MRRRPSLPTGTSRSARVAAAAATALVVLSGCAAPAEPAVLVPAAGVAARVPVEPVGPFRHTGRSTYEWSVQPVTAARLGTSHRSGCPTRVADLRLVRVTAWGFNGRTSRGELVVHRDVASDVVGVFRALHRARFPVERIETVDRYGGDDDRSMAANNTSAYNCRRTTSGTSWSEHAYGRALDVNPVQNPYVRAGSVEPEAGRAYLDRAVVRPGMVVAGDAVVRAFSGVGWEWGGAWRSAKDYQHFSQNGR